MPETRNNAADLQAIVNLTYRYATGLDTKNWSLLGSCFAEDGVLLTEQPVRTLNGREAISAGMQAMTEELDGILHIVSNHEYAVDGDTAVGVCLFAGNQWVGDPRSAGNMQSLGGRYHDELTHGPTGWVLSKRRISVLYYREW